MQNRNASNVDSLKASSRAVLAILRATRSPLSAYEILEAADSTKLKSPVQVYRALKILTNLTLVHRIETLNKYVACRCDHPVDVQPILAICDECGAVTEFPNLLSMHDGLNQLLVQGGFINRAINVEAVGLCQSCHGNRSV